MPVSSNMSIYNAEELVAEVETYDSYVWLRLQDDRGFPIAFFHFDGKGEAAVKKAQFIADAFNAMKEPKADEEPEALSTGME